MKAYIDGLKDLTPVQIQGCCERTLQDMSYMPTVADIRKHLYGIEISTRPEYLDEEPTSQEEIEAASEYTQKLRETLIKINDYTRPVSAVFQPVNSSEFSAMYGAYRQWLLEEQERDEVAKKQGLSPLPRSREERLAIFFNLPLAERNRLKKKAEWTKALTKNT